MTVVTDLRRRGIRQSEQHGVVLLLDGSIRRVAARGIRLAVDIARLPDQIKGYGHVKARHLAKVRPQWERLMQAWRNPSQHSQAA